MCTSATRSWYVLFYLGATFLLLVVPGILVDVPSLIQSLRIGRGFSELSPIPLVRSKSRSTSIVRMATM